MRVTPTCTSPAVLQNGLCVVIAPVCSINRVPKDGVCVPITCPTGQTPKNGVCTVTTCSPPNVFIDGVCTIPACVAPNVLRDGVCNIPASPCSSTRILINGTCQTPAASRETPPDYPITSHEYTCSDGRTKSSWVHNSPCIEIDKQTNKELNCQGTRCKRVKLLGYQCYSDYSVRVLRQDYLLQAQKLAIEVECAPGHMRHASTNSCFPIPISCEPPKIAEDGVCILPSEIDAEFFPQKPFNYTCPDVSTPQSIVYYDGPCGYLHQQYVRAYSCPYGRGSSYEGKQYYQCLADKSTGPFKENYQATANSYSGVRAPLTCPTGKQPNSSGTFCEVGQLTCTPPMVLQNNTCVTPTSSTGGSSGTAGGTGSLSPSQLAAANQCAALKNYVAVPDTIQIEGFCKIAYLDQCLDKVTGTETYKADATAQCKQIEIINSQLPKPYQCNYCPYPGK